MTAEITVVGGSYGEECSFPRRQIYRGSGGRAAAVLSGLGAQVVLHTMTGPQLGRQFGEIAQRLGYRLCTSPSDDDIWFRYRYPLGQPEILPRVMPIWDSPKSIEAGQILVFGMMEGRPATHARRVVYDPQDGARSKAYAFNGSTADELAVVVSYSEGRALTGETNPEDVARALLSDSSTIVAIVKCGPQGALVRTAQSSNWVYPFPTTRVYKVGSGDVFSAAFAYAWLIDDLSPIDSAWLASRMVAAYVESGQDRFSDDQVGQIRAEARLAHRRVGQGVARPIPDSQIYLAGPFFHASQQWAIDEARGALMDMGFRVFSPIHDVGEGLPEEVAQKDLVGLEKSSVVLALLDGLDAGTLFEVGYAVAKGIPVVAVAESIPAEPLTMLLGTSCHITDDLTSGIYAACWKVMGDA